MSRMPAPQDPQREWSLMNVLNQKGARPEDKPIRLGQLIPEDRRHLSAVPEVKEAGVKAQPNASHYEVFTQTAQRSVLASSLKQARPGTARIRR
jgi:Domain of Unknown Function with PDB structure (DUF3864)